MPSDSSGLDLPSHNESLLERGGSVRQASSGGPQRRPLKTLRRKGAALAVVGIAAISLAACGSSKSSSSSSSSGGGATSTSGGSATTTSGGGGTSTSSGAGTKAASGNGKTIDVGNISSIAGLGGTFSGFQAGVKAFFDYYNAHGGINGYKVNLTAIDDAADPGKNANAARTLVAQDHVTAIVGEASLADAASQKYLQAENIPVVGGWAASSAWLKPATNMFVSLMGPNVPYCGLWSSDAAKALGVKSIYFVAQAFPEAVEDAKCRAAGAKYEGIQVVGSIGQVSQTAVDYRPVVENAVNDHAGAIYFSTTADGQVKGIQAGEQLGYKGIYIVTQPAGLTAGLKSLGSAIDKRVITSSFSLLPTDPNSYSPEMAKYKAGIKQYESQYATDVTSVSGWAAGKLFADALTAVGPDSKAIEAWISKQSHYTFGGLQGPMNYTLGSRPNTCTTRLWLINDQFVRSGVAAKPPGFNCGVLINPATGKAYTQ